MNYIAMQIINKEKGEGKFVVLTGSAHVTVFNESVPGLSEILGCPNLVIAKKLHEAPSCKRNDMGYFNMRCFNLHVNLE